MPLQEDASREVPALLQHADANFRCLALQFLGRIRAVASADSIADKLWDEDLDVCFDAVAALGTLGIEQHVTSLLEFYREVPSGEHRVAVIEALGQIGGEAAESFLISVLEHRDKQWDEMRSEDWDDYRDACLKAIESLGRGRVAAAVPAIHGFLLNPENEDLYHPGVHALAAIGPEGHQALCDLLVRVPSQLQWRIVEALADLGDPADVECLSQLLDKNHPRVQEAILSALARLGGKLGGEAIAPWLQHAEPSIRVAALGHLAGQPTEVPPESWHRLLNDPDAEVRRAAIVVAGRTRLQAFGPLVEKRLNDPDQAVCLAAIEGMSTLGTEDAYRKLISVLRNGTAPPLVRLSALSALEGQVVVELKDTLFEVLKDPDAAVRRESLSILARLDKDGAPSLLTRLLTGPLEDSIPGSGGPEQGTEEPQGALNSDEAAEEVPGHNHTEDPNEESPGSISTLDAIMNPTTPGMATDEPEPAEGWSQEELSLLERIESDTRMGGEVMLHRNRPTDLDTRIHAARLLAEYPSEEALQPLRGALTEAHPPLQEEAARTLGVLGDQEAIAVLGDLIASPYPTVGDAAIKALILIGSREAIDTLRGGWPTAPQSVRPALLDALNQVADVDAGDILGEAINNKDPAVIKAAIRARMNLDLPMPLEDLLGLLARHPNFHWKGVGAGLNGRDLEGIGSAMISRLTAPESSREIPLLLHFLEEMIEGETDWV